MQTKQQQVTKFLNKQAQAHSSATPEPTTVMGAVVTVIEFMILGAPFAIAIAGFCGAFDALVK